MSSFPVAFDATFPGYPYVDEQDYVDATSANAWVAALQAIENTIGHGANGTAASPLYSAAYATTYSSITARIAALEGTVEGGLKLNSSNTLIQSVGGANVAGSSGLAADAAHVHEGQSAGTTTIGMVVMWPGGASNLPAGYLVCNGQLVSTSTYSALFGYLGYNFGGSAGSFALPNYNDKFPVGAGGSISPGDPGGTGGGSRTIAANQLPAHTHSTSLTDNGHRHASYLDEDGGGYQGIYTTAVPGTLSIAPFLPGGTNASYSPSGPGQQHWASATTGISISVAANYPAGNAYTPPYLGIYFIIRAL